jgi:hypothetical protein
MHGGMRGRGKIPFDYERCALRIEKEKKILGDESSCRMRLTKQDFVIDKTDTGNVGRR